MIYFLFFSDKKQAKIFCSRRVGKIMINAGVAIWNRTHLVPGRNIKDLIEEIENSKSISGGFHPHVANRILSQILADWGLSHHWKEPTYRNKNLWKYSCSINRRVDNRIRKFIFFIKTNIFFLINICF